MSEICCVWGFHNCLVIIKLSTSCGTNFNESDHKEILAHMDGRQALSWSNSSEAYPQRATDQREATKTIQSGVAWPRERWPKMALSVAWYEWASAIVQGRSLQEIVQVELDKETCHIPCGLSCPLSASSLCPFVQEHTTSTTQSNVPFY